MVGSPECNGDFAIVKVRFAQAQALGVFDQDWRERTSNKCFQLGERTFQEEAINRVGIRLE